MVSGGITVGIITHPPRVENGMLRRALDSVWAQTRIPEMISVRVDRDGVGAPTMRQRLLDGVQTEWLAWLDSDDEFKPEHLCVLESTADETGADYVYSWYDVAGGDDPRADEELLPWDLQQPRQTTIVTLVRVSLARAVGGYLVGGDINAPGRLYSGEDWVFTQRMAAAGAKIVKAPGRTWVWHHHAENSSGLPRWHRG